MTAAKHTPGLPERLSYEPDDGLGVTDAKTGYLLAETHDVALAAEIARRWNAHEELKAALRDLAPMPAPLMGDDASFRVVSDEGLLYAGAGPHYINGWHHVTAAQLRAARSLLARIDADGGSR